MLDVQGVIDATDRETIQRGIRLKVGLCMVP